MLSRRSFFLGLAAAVGAAPLRSSLLGTTVAPPVLPRHLTLSDALVQALLECRGDLIANITSTNALLASMQRRALA